MGTHACPFLLNVCAACIGAVDRLHAWTRRSVRLRGSVNDGLDTSPRAGVAPTS
jgi:hypothetical protein